MRKIIATALAFLMLAGVLLVPAMAAAAEPYDHTTATDVPSLVMTEIVANSNCGIKNPNKSNAEYDAFEYIEIYNRGDSAVNLYALSILRSPYCKRNSFGKESPYYTAWNTWQSSRKFLQKADIKSGNVRAEHVMDEEEKKAMGAAAVSSLKFENNLASNGALAPHKSAVLFFVSSTTISALSQYITKDLGGNNTNPDLARALFRDFYKIPEDVDIYYIWGYNSVTMAENDQQIAPDMFNLADCTSASEGYMYAIGEQAFDMDNETALDDAGNANPKIKCLMPYGATAKGHVATGMKGQSVQYIPADQVPAFWNYKEGYKEIKKPGYIGMQYDATKAGKETDFVVGDGDKNTNRVNSYKEMGLAYVQVEEPTPGVMPAYQWASVDPEHAPDSVKGTDPDWAAKAILAYLQARFKDFEQKDEKDHEDPTINPNLRPRDEIEKQFNQKDNNNNNGKKNNKSGLPVGALIGIIAGGVVVVGGGVTAVLLVMNKKKKAMAAVEAPAEAPAEGTEEKKDEE